MKNTLLASVLIMTALIASENKTTANIPFCAKEIKAYQLKDTSVKIAWREEVYDANLKQLVNSLVLNESYFSGISEPEKAALGYVASFIGNECRQDGGNVQCKILSALGMGYQCSDGNKEFLKKWFSFEPSIIEEIESCRSKLFKSFTSSTFDKITVTTKEDVIKVKYSVINANIKDNKLEQWNEELSFSLSGENLKLVKHTKKKK